MLKKSKQLQYNMYIKDHHDNYNNNEKAKILWELSNCDRDMKWANAIEKMVPIDLFEKGLSQISNL